MKYLDMATGGDGKQRPGEQKKTSPKKTAPTKKTK
jgi:hypothetical protein